MKKTYFIWLGIHMSVWILALWALPLEFDERLLAGISVFFILLFILPLFIEKPWAQTVIFGMQVLVVMFLFYPGGFLLDPYAILILSLIVAEAAFHLSRIKCLIVMGMPLLAVSVAVIDYGVPASQAVWCVLYVFLLMYALGHYQGVRQRGETVRMTNETLLDEYRRMKRQLVIEEEQARQDERMLIGHEIHDSVGHKLTALLLQFEAFRLTAAEKDKETVGKLKELAEQSLAETREAVKSFKQREVGGLQGVIRLIRKLEMESYMKIHFSVKHGAFAAPLTGEQSFAIYRAVQEALTNIMKHSPAREAQITFESPGGSIFRFEVSNQAAHNPYFQEGYGLKAMRERLEKAGGVLEAGFEERNFTVRGTIRLTDWRGRNDQSAAGGGSGDGPAGIESDH